MKSHVHYPADRRIKVRPLILERLEDRTVPTAEALGRAIDFDSLRVDPNSYDASSILVRFREGSNTQQCTEVLPGTQVGKVSALVPGLHLVQLHGVQVADALRAYRASPLVEYAEPNYAIQLTRTPNDPLFGSMYGLHNSGQGGGTTDADIDAPAAWDIATGSSEVVVAVIDTGVDFTHPDLMNNMWVNGGETPGNGIDDDGNGAVDDIHGANFIGSGTPTGDLTDEYVHGTHVAGTIGAEGDNGIGVVGVAWDVQIMALKVFDVNGFGTIQDAIQAFEYVTRMRNQYGVNVRVTSNSWRFGDYSQALYDAVAAGGDAGILFVAAAGNDLVDTDVTPMYPAAFDLPNVISVAATDQNDAYAWFTNYGATSIDLAAPGVDILSTLPGNTYGISSGTSMATPHVAGAAALVWSRFPELTPLQVKERLLSSVDVISDIPGNSTRQTHTNGRLNAQRALEVADDVIPPAPVEDLAVTGTTWGSITLALTASGDDGLVGTADFYDIRYSTAPIITDADFALARRVINGPSPGPPGSIESVTVSDLDFDTTYFFAVKVLDGAGNASSLSNLASAPTRNAVIAFAEDLESGAPGWTADGLWHLSNRRADSAGTSFYYGDENTGNYDTGAANSGSLRSPAIDLSAAGQAVLVFDEWRGVEDSAPYDGAYIRASSDGVNWTTIWADHVSTHGWTRRSVDLTPWVGGNLFVELYFDTLDEQFNFSEGWYLDDLTVLVPNASPGLYVTNAFVSEGQSGSKNVTFTAQLLDVSGGASVTWETADSSATVADDDYEYAAGAVTFAPGETRKTFTVAVNGDSVDETDEAFYVNLTNSSGADIVDGQARATLIDEDTAEVIVNPFSGLITTESGGASSFRVVLGSKPTGSVTVSLSSSDTSEGTVSPTSLTFTRDTWPIPQTVRLTGVNDSIDDGDVSYIVTATATSGDSSYNGLVATAAVTNQDNDFFAVYSSAIPKTIPDPGTVASKIIVAESGRVLDLDVRVNITHDRDEDLDVVLITPWKKRVKLFSDVGGSGHDFSNTVLDDEATADITAGSAPFTGIFRPEKSLSAADGHDMSGTWTLEIADDQKGPKKGKLESWSLSFLTEQSGNSARKKMSNSSFGAALPVPNDEPRISISDVTKAEGRKGKTTLFTFTVTLSSAYDQPVTMGFRTVNGTATTSNNDYVAKTGTLTFAPGQTTKTITIEVKGDNPRESDETFYLDLFGNSSNSLFSKNRGIGTILNDD